MGTIIVGSNPIKTDISRTFSKAFILFKRSKMCAVFAESRTVKRFLTVGALEHNKAIVGFQSFEFVGSGVFSAGVSENAGKPSTLFFDGEEVVNCWLIAGLLPTFGLFWVTNWFVVHGWVVSLGW